MAGCTLRVWRFGRGRLRPVIGCDNVSPPAVHADLDGNVVPADDERWISPVPDSRALWFEIADAAGPPEEAARTLGPLLAQLMAAESETLELAKQLQSRLEETELLYSISQVLGRTIRLETAAEIIVREVASVVGARRASIFVMDEAEGVLKPVAGVGKEASKLSSIPVDHPTSIAARVFREGELVAYDPRKSAEHLLATESGQHYLGAAFLSVPIIYPAPDGELRPVGVINFTNRVGTDAFSDGEQRLVAAVASQIASAIENARLVQRDIQRERVTRELELAHDLQLKLLPSPEVLGEDVDVAARCLPARSVGGDFYYFVKLSGGKIAVMLGDVSSHGFPAAIIMASVLSAAGTHAAEGGSPEHTVRRVLESVIDELTKAEMHLALFFAVLDPAGGHICYSNAGHPHAFRVRPDGTTERLGATSPPLGLSDPEELSSTSVPWVPGEDRLVLFSDGISDAATESGERFGEERVLDVARSIPESSSGELLEAILGAMDAFGAIAGDDRTILVLRS